MRRVLLFVVLACACAAYAEPGARLKRRRPATTATAAKPAPRSAPPVGTPGNMPALRTTAPPIRGLGPVDEETRFYRYRLVTSLGLHLLRTSAVAVGGQYGIAVKPGTPWYIGP